MGGRAGAPSAGGGGGTGTWRFTMRCTPVGGASVCGLEGVKSKWALVLRRSPSVERQLLLRGCCLCSEGRFASGRATSVTSFGWHALRSQSAMAAFPSGVTRRLSSVSK